MSPYDSSPASLRPLMKTYWSSAGWNQRPQLPDAVELDAAVGRGVMFRGRIRLTHAQSVETARSAAASLDRGAVGSAFAASLSTRRLDPRSALGSYAFVRHLPTHDHEARKQFIDPSCVICGAPMSIDLDPNVLSFERFKWGGVRRDDLAYVGFDLVQFADAPLLEPNDIDLDLLRRLLDVLGNAPAAATAAKTESALSFIPGSKAERAAALEILAVAGVLDTPEHPGYREAFVEAANRHDTGAHYEDRFYPLPWWRGRDGVNQAAVAEWFPFLS